MDVHGTVVLDELLLPKHKIVDYRTQWSGISEATLKGVTQTLEDVQEKIRALPGMNSRTILVGHSLNCDLEVLQWKHERIVDTSILFPHHKGANISLAAHYACQLTFVASIRRPPIQAFASISCQEALTTASEGHGKWRGARQCRGCASRIGTKTTLLFCSANLNSAVMWPFAFWRTGLSQAQDGAWA